MVNLINEDQLDKEVKKDLNLLGLKIRDVIKSHHPRRRAKSFRYAFSGVLHALLNEPNFRIQVSIVVISIVLGWYFRISSTEWGLLTLTMGLLLFAELVNTVVEEFIDNLIPHKDDGARVIKDVSAGFVLIMALTSLIILVLIFGKFFLPFLRV
ncbi:diacylglycerol kinase [candidate division WWE3 bacterium]|nr:diacylglycerol kinase [candidate division WWE3 bacterium]